MNLLLVEDSVALRRSLRIGLNNLGFTVDDTGDGAEGLSMALMGEYDLLILDLMLPSVDGLSILKALRKSKKDLRVLVLSAKSQAEDKVLGLLTGADEYLTKPFSFDELHARILNLMRRGALNHFSDTIDYQNVVLNLRMKTVSISGQLLNLTPNEYKVIECLFTHPNIVVSVEKLSTYLSGNYDAVAKNTIEAHLSSARKKARLLGAQLPIKTKRGFGYFLEGSE